MSKGTLEGTTRIVDTKWILRAAGEHVVVHSEGSNHVVIGLADRVACALSRQYPSLLVGALTGVDSSIRRANQIVNAFEILGNVRNTVLCYVENCGKTGVSEQSVNLSLC